MKKQGMKKHRKAEEMNGLLTAYDVSGQSVREFCVSQGIAEHLLRYWLKRRSLSVEQAEPAAGGGFTELQVSRGGCVGLVLPGVYAWGWMAWPRGNWPCCWTATN